MESKLSQDLEKHFSAAEKLCKYFQKKRKQKEKEEPFEPIIKQTEINDNLIIEIDGVLYTISGLKIKIRYTPEEDYNILINFKNNETLKNKLMLQMMNYDEMSLLRPKKSDVVFKNVLIKDQDNITMLKYNDVLVSHIDFNTENASLIFQYHAIPLLGSKYEKQLVKDLTLNSVELTYVQKAQMEQIGWYAECDD